jgi:4-diphosphocytidyl-2C-methyl-D-erythritol kinase
VRGRPGVLLVTPAVAIRTPDVFAVFDGIDGGGDGAVRMTSEHLAAEFSSGLSVNDLVARTGVLAAANDLFTAAALVEPGLVALRRALTRTLGRAFGLSGSGPTLWTLYASLAEAKAAAETVRLAVADETIPTIGVRPPTVIATTTQHDEEPRP